MARSAHLSSTLVVLLGAAACQNDRIQPAPVVQPSRADLGSAAPELVTLTFEEFYPRIIELHRDAGTRPDDWARHFEGRWVRWRGRIASFTPTGMTLRGRPRTVNYDISVTVDSSSRERLRRHHVDDEVTFVGRLKSYDDVFSTAYLDHGEIVDPTAAP